MKFNSSQLFFLFPLLVFYFGSLSYASAQNNQEPQKLIDEAHQLLLEDTLKALNFLGKIELSKYSLPDSSLAQLTFQKLNFIKEHAGIDSTIETTEKIIQEFKIQQKLRPLIKLRSYLADLYMESANYQAGIVQIEQALSELKKENLTEPMGELLLKKAALLYAESNYIQSIETVFDAIHHLEKSDQGKQIAFAYLQIGSTYLFMDYLDEADEYYRQAAEYFSKEGDQLGVAICQSNLGLIAHEKGDYAGAIEQLKASLKEILKSKREIMTGYAYQSIAESYLAVHEIDSALHYCKRSFRIDQKLNYNSGQAKDYYLLAAIQNELGNSDSALYFGEQSLDLLDQEEDYEIDHALSLLLANIYSRRGNLKKSNQFLRRRIEVMEAIEEDNKKIKQLSSREDKRLTETMFELELSKEREKLQKISNQNQEKIILILVYLCLFFLIGLTIVLIYNRKNKKLNRELNKELITKRSLLKEIHHRVKNNLQIIASMLSIQSQYIKDENFKKILSDCRGRINSMSLIHESLYKSEEREFPLFNHYVEELIPRLIKTYQVDEQDIQLKMDLQKMELSLDESIPCGLIIHEAISNSLKHAFEKDQKGEIEISMKNVNNRIKLLIADNGKGLPKDFKLEEQDSFGFLLIHSLSNQLEADISIQNEAGLQIRIEWEKDFSKTQ